MIALDTETTGRDLHHGCKPFFCTICDSKDKQTYFEWNVNPLTRDVEVPPNDLHEIRRLIDNADSIVGQNIKFDVHALSAIGITDWPWEKTEDTLIAAHLLASNQKHDLTNLAMDYLSHDIKPYEAALEKAVKKCRGIARSKYKTWRIAKEDLPEMPSIKGTGGKKGVDGSGIWRADYWLPRAIATTEKLLSTHEWFTVLRDYSNVDSAITKSLWPVMEDEIRKRGLWEIYRERMKVVPIAYRMEHRPTAPYGVSINKNRLEELKVQYVAASEKAAATCVDIAWKYSHELQLPKSGNNKSLSTFVFDVLKLPPQGYGAKSGAPSLDKESLLYWSLSLPPGDQLDFVKSLTEKRNKDTSIAFLRGYERFMLPLGNEWYVLHPSLNITGSDTLRWSSSNPNSQNFKKGDVGEGTSLRYCLGPLPGREWWSLDAQNIELRIPAYESGEQSLIELYERPNDPPYYGSNHLLNFSVVYPDVWEEALDKVGYEKVGPHCKSREGHKDSYYQWCKNGDFAIQYGAGETKADATFRRRGAYRKLKERFAKLEALNQKYVYNANRYGYVETIPDSAVNPHRGYPLLCSRINGRVKPTLPFNYHVQSTAMWWTMVAMIECEKQLAIWRIQGFDAWIVLQVHDELVFDMPAVGDPRNDYDKTRKDKTKLFRTSNLWRIRALQRIMEGVGDRIGIPTPTGCEYHSHNWGEGVTL